MGSTVARSAADGVISYDLLCLEGLARALRIFLQLSTPPTYTLSKPSSPVEVFIESSVRICESARLDRV